MRVSLWLGLLFCFFLVRGTALRVFTTLGGRAELPCRYEYEDAGPIQELSVQWKGPQHQLLCHFIKHKAFRNCSGGYALDYAPGRIRLCVEEVTAADAGPHVCSVSKQHAFTDSVIELHLTSRSATAAPLPSKCLSGKARGSIPLVSWVLLLCFWGRR
nr:uncharacterized protein LOC111846276 [Paramormyrops kingsleyae]